MHLLCLAEMLDLKHVSAEQIDFLDKFFKENPWAENAQVDSIVKETGLAASMVKVTSHIAGLFVPIESSHSSGLRRATARQMEFNVSIEQLPQLQYQ